MNKNIIKYSLNVLIILFVFAFILFILDAINFKTGNYYKKVFQKSTIEGLEQNIITGADAFCESYKGSSGDLNTQCGKLTRKNCNATSCCVLTSEQKCLAGNADGPTFNTNNNGKTINCIYESYL